LSEKPKTKEECDAAGGTWNAETGTCKLPTALEGDVPLEVHKALLAKNEVLKLRVTQLEKVVDEATKRFNLTQAQYETAEKAEKDSLIAYFIEDSKDKTGQPTLSADDFKDFSLKQLYDHKKLLAKSGSTGFVSIAQQRQEDAIRKPHGTVGIYNPVTKQWEDGV
jgi:hypothetical protein